jgi:hypothetical protein
LTYSHELYPRPIHTSLFFNENEVEIDMMVL